MATPISDIPASTPAIIRPPEPVRNISRQESISAPSEAVSPAYRVSLSSAARNPSAAEDSSSGKPGAVAPGECETCSSRKYVDVSNDATVSFQTPTRMSPGTAESMVRAHEQEHVTKEQARAAEEGNRVVAQNVAIRYSICPDCGTSYVAGGTTTTVTRQDGEQANPENDPQKMGGFSTVV